MSEEGDQFDIDVAGGVPRGEGESIEEAAARLRAERDARGEAWRRKAESNIECWGNQEAAVLLLALAEEIGEVADEVLATAERALHDGMYSSHAFKLLSEIRHIGFTSREFLEEHFENEHGNPLPEDEMPALVHDLDEERVLDEVDDAAPLVYQLVWALQEADTAEGLEPRERCPDCSELLVVESEDPLEEYCINPACGYYRAADGNGGVIQGDP